jgi:thiamine transport system ATP-binding protein
MDVLRTEDLTAGYGSSASVLAGIAIDVRAGEIVALLGASGSGKSTLLRCIAGLHPLRSGRVVLDGRDVRQVAVEQRGIGLVFQDHALFPHRDVAGNVAFGPRMQGLDRDAIARRVDMALTSVGIAHLRDRAADELSGGEQQRVALARALASQPRLLLLDEPYGSLDRPLRERLIAELPTLVRGTDRGAVLVTHDQQEALRVADRIAVLVGGRLRQLDTPERVWAAPADADVAAFLDIGPLLDAAVSSGTAHGAFGAVPTPGTPDGPVRLLLPRTALELDAGGTTADADVSPAPAPQGPRGTVIRLEARVLDVRFAGDHHRVEVLLRDGTRVVLRTRRSPEDPAPGAPIALRIARDAIRVLPSAVGDRPSGQ